jgi:hypothetical protein
VLADAGCQSADVFLSDASRTKISENSPEKENLKKE